MNQQDLQVIETKPVSALDRRYLSWLNDPRDLDFVHLIVLCFVVELLGIALFFVPVRYTFLVAPIYWMIWGFGVVDRFTLMLHCTSHRPLFKNRRWNMIIPWLLGPFFGQTPEAYFAHHMGMHHPENNLPPDLSSTMKFRRDRPLDWLKYYGTFMAFGLVDLARYHQKKKSKKLVQKTIVGEVLSMIIAVGLCFVNWRATVCVFIGPLVVMRILMMAGNWAQHAFIDANDAANPYRNSITCINTRYNRRCFHDGYHVHHHLKPRAHWTEYPKYFADNIDEYGKQDTIVFEGTDFFQVWVYLMLGRWETLAKHFVQLPGAPTRSKDEVILFLQRRCQPALGPSASEEDPSGLVATA